MDSDSDNPIVAALTEQIARDIVEQYRLICEKENTMHPMHRIAHMMEMLRAYVQENRRLPPEFQMHVNALHDEADHQERQRSQDVEHPLMEQHDAKGHEEAGDEGDQEEQHEEAVVHEDERPALTRPEADQDHE